MRLHKVGIRELDLREDAIVEAGAFAIDLRPGLTGQLEGTDRLRRSDPTGEQINVHALPFGQGREPIKSGDQELDTRAFSSEVDTGSRQENASKQQSRARSDCIGTGSNVTPAARQGCASAGWPSRT